MTSPGISLINKCAFAAIVNGKSIDLFTLQNQSGTSAQITNYGGRVVSIWVADNNGKFDDVVLGFSNIDDYFSSSEKYFGALIGRYGNRIAKGKFNLEDKEYSLSRNNGLNHLHGGHKGYHEVIWDAKQVDSQTLELSYLSKHMEEGYPGNLDIKVKYELTNENELKVEYWANTDDPTIVNLTHHSFFNLKGAGNGHINDHQMQINADYYTPVDETLIPTGEIQPVKDTPFDFRQPVVIGDGLNQSSEQLKYGLGYDHNFVLNKNTVNSLVSKVIEPISGRILEVFTNEPGLQFYGGNFLDGSITGKEDKKYEHRSAFCLETQHFPDSPNHDNFPITVLKPGEEYYSFCTYKFSAVPT